MATSELRPYTYKYTEEELEEIRQKLRELPTFDGNSFGFADCDFAVTSILKIERDEEQMNAYKKYAVDVLGGRISIDYAMEILKRSCEPLHFSLKLAEICNKTGDGLIGKDDFNQVVDLVSKHIGRRFSVNYERFVKEADKKQDGKVTLQECADWLEKYLKEYDDSKLKLPIENSTKLAFFDYSDRNLGYIPLELIREDVKKAWAIQEAIIKGTDILSREGGYSGERYFAPPHLDARQDMGLIWDSFKSEWLPHIASCISWHEGFSLAIVCDTYRRLTSPEFQSPQHMRLVYILAITADMIANKTVIFDDWLDGCPTRNNSEAYHVSHPKSFMNDGVLLEQMAIKILKKHIPDYHPAKQEIIEKSISHIHRNSYFAIYNSRVLRGIHKLSKFPPTSTSKEKHAGNPERNPFDKMGIQAYYEFNWFRAWQYLRHLVDLGRLAACYNSPNLDLDTYYRTIDLATQICCLTDDLLDYTKEQVLEDVRTGELGSHITMLLEIVNYGYPVDIFGEGCRDNFPTTTNERNKMKSIIQENFATGCEEDARKIMELFNKSNVKRILGSWLEREIRELDKLINSNQGVKLNTEWIRRTLLNTGIGFQMENNKDGRKEDQVLVTKIQKKFGKGPDYFKGLLLALIDAAKNHDPKNEILE